MDSKNIDSKVTTIGDVALALGVSKTTVSRAISGKGRVGAGTREKVLKYISEHNYRPNVIAKGLATNRTYNIGLTLPGDYDLVDLPFFQKCMMGVSEMASSMDYDVIISLISNSNDISQLERLVDNHKVDGFILSRTYVKDNPAEFLKSRGVPFVTIGSSSDTSIIQVDNDHEGACRELTSILLMRGLRRIALIGGNHNYVVSQKRLNGYLDAFRQQRLSASNDMIYMDTESPIMIEKTVEDLVSRKAECILCMDDAICRHVLDKLSKDGIRVPEDIKVASFYNSSLLENNAVSITSLQFDVRKLGIYSCHALLDILDGKTVQQRTELEYTVSMKESTKI